MKSRWNNLCESLSEYGELIDKTLELLPATKQFGKIKKQIAKDWDGIIKLITDIDRYVDPVNPPEIKYPFLSDRFKAVWEYYKNYLENDHQLFLSPWNENSRLGMLARFSKNDEERAMLILELMSANNYRNIICPSEKQLSGEEQIQPEPKATNLSLSNIPEEI